MKKLVIVSLQVKKMPIRTYGDDIRGIPPLVVLKTLVKIYAYLKSHPNQWVSVDRLIEIVQAPFQAVNFAYKKLKMLPRIETRYATNHEIRFRGIGKVEENPEKSIIPSRK